MIGIEYVGSTSILKGMTIMAQTYNPSIQTRTDRDGWKISYSTYQSDKYEYHAKVGATVELVVDEPQRLEDAVSALENVLSVIKVLRAANASVKALIPETEPALEYASSEDE
jgi:hypothetical protein